MKTSELKTKNSIAGKIKRIFTLSRLIRFSQIPREARVSHERNTLQKTWHHSEKRAGKIARLNAEQWKAKALQSQESRYFTR